MSVNVIDSRQKQAAVILEPADSDIAVGTEKRTDFTGGMAVIDGEMDGSAFSLTTRREFTDSADSTLFGQHAVVVFDADPVRHQKVSVFLLKERSGISGFFKNTFHIRKARVNWFKFAGSTMCPGMFVAGSNVKKHAFKRILLTTISAWFEFPSTRASFDSAVVTSVNTNVLLSPLMISGERAFFAVIHEAINIANFIRKGIVGFNGLAGRAWSISILHRWNLIADIAPVAAKFLRGCIAFTESTSNGFFSGHMFSLYKYRQNVNWSRVSN